MTPQEAIDILKSGTISAQEKLRARDAAINALEKRIPKEIERIEYSIAFHRYVCPRCKQLVDKGYHYCSFCGQALDWS